MSRSPFVMKSPRTYGDLVASRDGLAPGGVDRGGDLVEGALGVGAEGADGGDADDDDERQHDRVLDGRRAVLSLQEVERELTELTHVPFSLCDEEPTNVWRPRRFPRRVSSRRC